VEFIGILETLSLLPEFTKTKILSKSLVVKTITVVNLSLIVKLLQWLKRKLENKKGLFLLLRVEGY
jgi:hypothetical protein